jgi:hypothetical protein
MALLASRTSIVDASLCATLVSRKRRIAQVFVIAIAIRETRAILHGLMIEHCLLGERSS